MNLPPSCRSCHVLLVFFGPGLLDLELYIDVVAVGMLYGFTDAKALPSNLCMFPGTFSVLTVSEFLVANLLVFYPDILSDIALLLSIKF